MPIRLQNEIEHRLDFYSLLELNKNSELCFRMSLLNIRYRIPNFEAATLVLTISFEAGHVGAKYVLAMLKIFSCDLETHKLGTIMLTGLWRLKVLFECRI